MAQNKNRAGLKAGITLASFLTQLAALADDKKSQQKLKDTNRVLKALRLLGLLGSK